MVYDRGLFLEIIESVQGVIFLREDNRDGIHARFFQGVTGKLCVIDTTDMDDDIVGSEGIGYLKLLGLEYLIASLFPEPVVPNEEEKNVAEEDCVNIQYALPNKKVVEEIEDGNGDFEEKKGNE